MVLQVQLSEKIEIDEMELGVLLGNLLDNAIEAAEKITDSPMPSCIHVQIRALMDRIWICVDNPTVEKSGPVSNLSSTKQDKEHHGYGLQSVQSIAEKYDGSLSITWDNYCFTIEIGLSNLRQNVFAS